MIKKGDILVSKKENYWDGNCYCCVGQKFIVETLNINIQECSIVCIDYKGKQNSTIVSSCWLISNNKELINSHICDGLEYIFDFFEPLSERRIRLAKTFIDD